MEKEVIVEKVEGNEFAYHILETSGQDVNQKGMFIAYIKGFEEFVLLINGNCVVPTELQLNQVYEDITGLFEDLEDLKESDKELYNNLFILLDYLYDNKYISTKNVYELMPFC